MHAIGTFEIAHDFFRTTNGPVRPADDPDQPRYDARANETAKPPKHVIPAVSALLASLVLPLSLMFGATTANATEPQGQVAGWPQNQGMAVTQKSESKAPATVVITESTPVVTASSGYHIKLSITNHTGESLPAGKLQVSTNQHYNFASRTDLQDWAEGDTAIPTTNKLGEADVPAIGPDSKVEASVDTPADNPTLASILSWGPKPVLVTYLAGQDGADHEPISAIRTFMTRSGDGIPTADTPPMDITIAMPLTTSTWNVDPDTVTKYLTSGDDESKSTDTAHDTSANGANGKPNAQGTAPGATSASKTGQNPGGTTHETDQTDLERLALTPTAAQSANGTNGDGQSDAAKTTLKPTDRLPKSVEQLIAKHTKLQVVIDPAYAMRLKIPPQSSGIMQPGAFDITSYSALGDDAAYRSAGITPGLWNEAGAQDQWRNALGEAKQGAAAYAWQGDTKWTVAALAAARSQGYGTVIAQGTVDEGNTDTTQTAKYLIPTPSGDVTLLAAQSVLTELAQGHSTAKSAEGETSDAGRLARFMAQTAFYQMERPYTARNILVCLGTSAGTASGAQDADALMHAVEQAPWLRQSDLKTLNASQTAEHLTDERAQRLLPSSGALSSQNRGRLQRDLTRLSASRNDIARFENSILSKPTENGPKGATGAKTDGHGMGHPRSSNTANDSGDAQSLARQDARDTAKRSKNGASWIHEILMLHDAIGLNALSINSNVSAPPSGDVGAGATGALLGDRMTSSAVSVASQLVGGVSITPSEPITIVSESATMPVTIRNNHPYPVQVKVSSITDSMEIVTSRLQTVTIPAKSETQTTFTIRASTSGSTDAHLNLLDRNRSAFGSPQTTHITCAMRLSDKSGLAFIGVSLLFGVLGLWRQFHIKKDPDQ